MPGPRLGKFIYGGLSLFAGLLLACRSTAAEELSRSNLRPYESPEITQLKQIEERVLPLPLVAGVPRHESLPDYYWETNVALRSRLDQALRAFESGQPSRYRALTIVAGSAGVGKTFIKQCVYRDWVPESQIWKFDVREMFGELADEGLAEMKADLGHGDQVINRLLCLKPAGREKFTRMLQMRSPAFLVVDSIDEVHPDDYGFVLSELERFALHGDRPFMHVVVFGRPLAFREYWRDRCLEGLPQGLSGYVLNPPDFRTTGDLLVSSWNYDCWKLGLSRIGLDGQTHSMTFPEFRKWCDCDFTTTGEFANVTLKENCSARPELCEQLEQWSKQHRVVVAVLPNLGGNSIAREILEQRVERGQPFDERAFMDEFFQRWLERDTQSDDRPSRLKPQHLELYVKLLEAVAAKYVDEHRVGRLGYFDVADTDRIAVKHRGETVSVPVGQVLNRSGLVTLDPVSPEAARYRFEPFWFHRLLVQMHHQRETGPWEQSAAFKF